MIEQTLQSLSHFLPETVLACFFCVIIAQDLMVRNRPALSAIIALLGVLLAVWFSFRQIGVQESLFSGMVVVDAFAVYFKLVVGCTAFFILLMSAHSAEVQSTPKRAGEYYALLLAMTLGMYLMASAANLLMMVLAMELTSLSSYILAGYTKEAPDSSEASLKYVLYGAVSSGLMLYGISILYGLTGATDFQAIKVALAAGHGSNGATLAIAIILMLVGFGYKISAVPFHFWTPDVYEGAPITITAFLSVASKAAGFAMMLRFFVSTSAEHLGSGLGATLAGFDWTKVVVILSVLTMTLGNLVALWQDNLKRMLAYSSIAHAGYMLMGVVVFSRDGIASVLIYFVVYLFMNLGAFYAVMLIANKTGSEHVDDYKGLGGRAPLLSVALVILLISLTGLPPTAGFIGKLYLFIAVLQAKWVWLAVVGALNSVVSLYYYVRVFRNIFLRDSKEAVDPIEITPVQLLLLMLFVVPTLILGVYFAPVVDFANISVSMFSTP
jgi:NADH-quinone oxidoreductase subunit N